MTESVLLGDITDELQPLFILIKDQSNKDRLDLNSFKKIFLSSHLTFFFRAGGGRGGGGVERRKEREGEEGGYWADLAVVYAKGFKDFLSDSFQSSRQP